MKTAICPGSFDPITLGHLNIIRRTSRIFEKVIILVLPNTNKKKCMFSIPERIELISRVIANFPNVTVETYDGLLADFAKRVDSPVIVKGLRANTDFENEFQMAHMNRRLHPELETIFMMTSQEHFYVSSQTVKEVAFFNGDVSGVVPPAVLKRLISRRQGGENQ